MREILHIDIAQKLGHAEERTHEFHSRVIHDVIVREIDLRNVLQEFDPFEADFHGAVRAGNRKVLQDHILRILYVSGDDKLRHSSP